MGPVPRHPYDGAELRLGNEDRADPYDCAGNDQQIEVEPSITVLAVNIGEGVNNTRHPSGTKIDPQREWERAERLDTCKPNITTRKKVGW